MIFRLQRARSIPFDIKDWLERLPAHPAFHGGIARVSQNDSDTRDKINPSHPLHLYRRHLLRRSFFLEIGRHLSGAQAPGHILFLYSDLCSL